MPIYFIAFLATVAASLRLYAGAIATVDIARRPPLTALLAPLAQTHGFSYALRFLGTSSRMGRAGPNLSPRGVDDRSIVEGSDCRVA